MTQDTLDIRDFAPGQTYFVVTSDERGGRCVMNGMFIAAWATRGEAETERLILGPGFHVVETVKHPGYGTRLTEYQHRGE